MQLSEYEAYNAMVSFLDTYYQLTKSDDVGSLLGGMMMLADGTTADPAAWYDWLEAIEKGKNETKYLNLK